MADLQDLVVHHVLGLVETDKPGRVRAPVNKWYILTLDGF